MPLNGPFHILQVVASLQGGAAWHVFWLSTRLRARGHTVEIAAPADNPSLQSRILAQEIPFHEIPLHTLVPWEAAAFLARRMAEGGLTHVHVHGHRAAAIARPARLWIRHAPPLVYTIHGYHPAHYPNPVSRRLFNAWERIFALSTAAFICVSPSAWQEFLAAVPTARPRAFLIENAVPGRTPGAEDIQLLRQTIRDALALPQDSYVIGSVARLHWQKGVDRLIQAFHSLSRHRNNLYLLIIGDGPERTNLERMAERLGIAPHCIFTGNRPNARYLYAMMDLFVLPSRWEGLPLTILEAWNAGTPVIATDVSGSRDLIQHGVNGFLADDSVEGIASAILRALQSGPDLTAMVQNARRTLSRRFSLSRMTAQTEAVYQQVLE
ncbi:MAG: glycosyltransferase family 4 protein [Candidatus Omnitrophica bacterium]|nr:glycosyltransferase family 4 protein [Candidatus Omnitrophota bacterium]